MVRRSGTDTCSIFVFVDALGWALLRDREFLLDLLPERHPVETVLGYSCACDPTILTGVSPSEHGHFSFFRYAPERSPFKGLRGLGWVPSAVADRARVRRLLSRGLRRWYGYTGYFELYSVPFRYLPQFEYTETRDLYQPGGINGGQPTVFDYFRDAGLPHHVSDWRQDERTNLAAAEQALTAGHVRAAYVYLAGLDGRMHTHGTRAPAVDRHLAWYEQRLRRLVDVAARQYGDVRVHLFSDHGMADVHDVCDLAARVDRTGYRFGTDYTAVYDSTMARFWFASDAARQAIEAALSDEPAGHLLSDAELAAYGADFSDRSYGESIFLLEPGVLLCPSFMGRKPIAGMHGYRPTHPQSTASYLSNVAVPRPPRRLQDLFGLMLDDVGLAV
jgi:hypothetical protein